MVLTNFRGSIASARSWHGEAQGCDDLRDVFQQNTCVHCDILQCRFFLRWMVMRRTSQQQVWIVEEEEAYMNTSGN